jgi:hypothetical protein
MTTNLRLYVIPFTLCLLSFATQAQESPTGYKTTVDMEIDSKGSVLCEFNTKYNASMWDIFTRTIGNNTSILKNNLIRTFPKYVLTDFQYSQDAGERTNKIKFRINGMMNINKNGKWEADLERKNPDITKISNREYLVVEEGITMKLKLPPGTSDSKVEKNSFGTAILTYSAKEGSGGMMGMLRYAGYALILAGGWLFYRFRFAGSKQPLQTIYDAGQTGQKTIPSPRQQEIPQTTATGTGTESLPGRHGEHANSAGENKGHQPGS